MTAQPTRDQLRALADAATEGPWETFKTNLGRDNGIGSASPTVPSDEAVMEDAWSDPADAAFIAAARTAVPQLLDQLDQAEAELDSWMTRAYEAEKRAWQAEARIKAVRDVLAHHPYGGPEQEDAIRRALEG